MLLLLNLSRGRQNGQNQIFDNQLSFYIQNIASIFDKSLHSKLLSIIFNYFL